MSSDPSLPSLSSPTPSLSLSLNGLSVDSGVNSPLKEDLSDILLDADSLLDDSMDSWISGYQGPPQVQQTFTYSQGGISPPPTPMMMQTGGGPMLNRGTSGGNAGGKNRAYAPYPQMPRYTTPPPLPRFTGTISPPGSLLPDARTGSWRHCQSSPRIFNGSMPPTYPKAPFTSNASSSFAGMQPYQFQSPYQPSGYRFQQQPQQTQPQRASYFMPRPRHSGPPPPGPGTSYVGSYSHGTSGASSSGSLLANFLKPRPPHCVDIVVMSPFNLLHLLLFPLVFC